jgi:hypothetical protein
MDNQNYKVDVHVNDDKDLHYGDFALGVAVGTTLIPAIYGLYTWARKRIESHREKKQKEAMENEEAYGL